MKNYGFFNAFHQFVISDPRTPEAWLHYLIRPEQEGTNTFCSGVTNTAGGFDIKGTHENTITDTKLHLNDADDLGRYLYIKDVSTSDFWSATWQPIKKPTQKITTTFSFGSVLFDSLFNDVHSEIEMFVPKSFDGWIQNIKITNTGKKTKKLEIYPFVPIHMGDALVRLLAGDNDGFFGGASWDPDLNGIVIRRHHGIAANDNPEQIQGMLGNVALFYSTLNTNDTQYDTSLETFYGDRFHDQKNPLSIINSKLSSKNTAHLRRTCGVFNNEILLEPGQTIEFAVSLSLCATSNYYLQNKTDFLSQIAILSNKNERITLLTDVKTWWKNRLSLLSLSSSDNKINRAFSWLQYQCEIVLVLNRMKSRFHTGYEYGWGFRDILQDILYLLPYRPEEMKSRLSHVATQIFSTGQVYHNFFITQKGNKSIEASDDPLWFIQAVIKYCKETGNLAYLDSIQAYADSKEDLPFCKASILDQCIVCMERVISDRSPRGLPWMKDCDWNDDLNEVRINGEPSKNLESIMTAQQLHGALRSFSELLTITGHTEKALRYSRLAEEIKKALFHEALDSEGYFKRALDSHKKDEDPGSSTNIEGKIFLETQIFAINCDVTNVEQSKILLATIEKELDTPWGAMLCWPYFTKLAQNNELPKKSWNIEKEPPGIKENGSIFMHLNAWLIEAYCRTGQGTKAVALYLKTLPETLSKNQDSYRCEPYVYPEYVRGKDIDGQGRGGHTWLTGTAPTMHTSLTEWIFGIRPTWDGLLIDPCVSPLWKSFNMTRTYRGATWNIQFENPNGVETGVKKITVDGKEITGCILTPGRKEEIHTVTVEMGK